MNKCINSENVLPGDLLMEIGRGGCTVGGVQSYSLRLWEFPDNYEGQEFDTLK